MKLEDYVLASASEYVASMHDADKAIAQRAPAAPLAEAIAEFEAEHGPLDDEG